MKFAILMSLTLFSIAAFAADVKDFNRVLIKDVQHDIHNDNDQALKTNMAPMRGPASVDEVERVPNQEVKFEKRNVRQTGMEKW